MVDEDQIESLFQSNMKMVEYTVRKAVESGNTNLAEKMKAALRREFEHLDRKFGWVNKRERGKV